MTNCKVENACQLEISNTSGYINILVNKGLLKQTNKKDLNLNKTILIL